MGMTSDTTSMETVATITTCGSALTPKECCIKSGGRCGCAKPKSPTRKDILSECLKQYDSKDLRFLYFKSRKCPDIHITIVSILDRVKCTLKVAFSFSSPKDSFCKADGKIKCFKKLNTVDHPHVVTVPWLDDGLLCAFLAYNRLTQKPEKLARYKFDDLIPSAAPTEISIKF